MMCVAKLEGSARPRFLVLLFGEFEYDGRAQRMLKILKTLGDVLLVDVSSEDVQHAQEPEGIRRMRVRLPKRAGKVTKHLKFWWATIRAAQQESPALVVAENYFTTLPGWIAAKLCKAKLCYDAYELIIPDPTRRGLRELFWYCCERWVVRRADLVIAANEERARIMAQHYGLNQEPLIMHNIPHVSNEYVVKEDVLQRFPELKKRGPEDVLVLYQGNVSLNRGLKRIVEAMHYLPANWRLIIVGDGPDLDRLREQARVLESAGRFATIGRVPYRLLPHITRLADVGIVTYPFQGLNNIYCAPNKIFEYAQGGLPVVATNQPPLRRWVERYGIGKLISEHDTPKRIAEAIKEVVENKAQYAKALVRFLEDHRWEDEAERVRTGILHTLAKLRGEAHP